MAKGTKIIVSADPRGKFEEGIISGTPKPGVIVEYKTGTAPVGGRFTFVVAQRSSGAKGGIAVLLEDELQGFSGVSSTAAYTGGPPAPGTAYVTGTRCRIYWPIAGEDLNLLVTNQTGTGDDAVTTTTLYGVETLTGALKKDSSYASAPFLALEDATDPTADFMLWVKYLGNNA